MDYKIKIDPKREYRRHADGDIVPGPEDLSMSEYDYAELTMDNDRFITVTKMFNDEYQRVLSVGSVGKSERRRAKLTDHWYRRVDKAVLREILIKNLPNAVRLADELGAKEENPHFRGYYFEASMRLREYNLNMPEMFPDNRLAHFPKFDGKHLSGTPLQMFRMYMAFFPSVKRKTKTLDWSK